ncbi:MAG: hypothetical protein BWY90_01077 [Deltaproteobacteria bacterium ADurb.BinA014]|nr:MAG: hypothetical protein BWY90_01077 [Deltaproteobacteria bacterium ADurb.BinA014]HPH12044.1 hypothetical protein [Thermotogota bacterium]
MAKKEIPRRLVKPFLESVRDFNGVAEAIDRKKATKNLNQEEREEIEALFMHATFIRNAMEDQRDGGR